MEMGKKYTTAPLLQQHTPTFLSTASSIFEFPIKQHNANTTTKRGEIYSRGGIKEKRRTTIV